MPLGQWSGHIWADLDLVPSRSPTPQARKTGEKKTILDDIRWFKLVWLCYVGCVMLVGFVWGLFWVCWFGLVCFFFSWG